MKSLKRFFLLFGDIALHRKFVCNTPKRKSSTGLKPGQVIGDYELEYLIKS